MRRSRSRVEKDQFSTEVIRGIEDTAKKVQEVFENCGEYFCGFGDSTAPSLAIAVPLYYGLYKELKRRGIRCKAITEITSYNMEYCRKLVTDLSVELRHLDSARGNFVVTESEYLATSMVKDSEAAVQLIYSNEPAIVDQNQFIFESLWAKAAPAEQKFKEIETGELPHETKVISGPLEILRETERMVATSKKYCVSSVPGGLIYAYNYTFDQFKSILDRHRRGEHGGIRWLTTVDRDSIEIAKKFADLGMTIRHVPYVPSESFGFSEKEVGVTVSRLEGGKLNSTAIFSNDPMYVEHYATLFEELWKGAVDLGSRVLEIEQGFEEPRMRILRNQQEIQIEYLDLINDAKEEVLLLLPSVNAFNRDAGIGVIDALGLAAARGVRVQMLAPLPPGSDKVRRLLEAQKIPNLIEYRTIREATKPNTVTILVIDRNASLIIELQDDSKSDFTQAVGVGTYSTRGSTVKANIRFFERMWEEVQERQREELLLEKERRSRREAELLQDILAHDIRNYNQIAKTSAELLKIKDVWDADHNVLIEEILASIDRTSALVDRARRLGKIISGEKPRVYSVDLLDSLKRSIDVVVKANGQRSINVVLDSGAQAKVLADDFLDDVFTNILSNSVNNTEKNPVPIEVTVAQEKTGQSSQEFWKITVTDQGKGMKDETKARAFTRYLDTAKGSGLGLSIVHALVVERYSAKVKIRNRVEGDYRGGTVIEVWLPKSA